jgi:hypothetical protein
MQTVKQQMLEQTNVDGFVFTDLLEKDVVFTSGMTRVARWDGVTRKPSLEGPGQGVTAEFDWARPAAAATIRIAIFNRDLVKVFDGAGGMDMTDAVDTRSGLDFVRRRIFWKTKTSSMRALRLPCTRSYRWKTGRATTPTKNNHPSACAA